MSGDRRNDRRDAIAREVDDELRSHIEMRARDNERAGMKPDEARREAERAFGDYRRIARASLYQRTAPRDAGGGPVNRIAGLIDSLRQDVVHALRGFARSPGLFAAALLTLSIGMGATTSIYSLANWMLLRPIPGVEAPENLSTVWVGRRTPEGGFMPAMLSTPNFHDVAERMSTITGLAGYQRFGVSVATGDAGATAMEAAIVSASYFDVLGVQPALGRTFGAADDTPGTGAHVAVIGDRAWASLYDRDPRVLGKRLRINGIVFTVVGVAPPGFQGTELFEGCDLWVPGAVYGELSHAEDPARYAGRGRGWFYMLVGRRSPGVTWDRVAGEFDTLQTWLVEQFPEENSGFAEWGFHVWRTFGTPPLGVDVLRQTLALLMGVSALVLLIASANVANLLLLRGLGRQSEVALRRALGGARGRLLRQYLTEGAVLWLLGGCGGLLLARLLAGAFEGTRVGYAEVAGVTLDGRVVGFAAASALLVGLLFAALPAVATLRAGSAGALRDAHATAGRRRLWARGMLTALQLGATLTLLVGALLLVETLTNLTNVDLGFDPGGTYVFRADTRAMGYSQAQTFDYYMEFERRLRLQPGIAEVAVAGQIPLQCCGFGDRVYPAGEDPEEAMVGVSVVTLTSPTFFELFDISMLRGRTFRRDEVTRPGAEPRNVVIVSETLAEQLFGDTDVVGRSLRFPSRNNDGPLHEIVGVVGDVYYRDLTSPPEALLYQPAPQPYVSPWQYIAVRTSAPAVLAGIAHDVAADLDDALPVGEVLSMAEITAGATSQWRLLARLMALLAGFAALLSAVGLYGVVGFMVRARARELGIRIALGASARGIVSQVLRSILATTVAGLLVGLGGALALVRVLESRLYGVAPFDPSVWLAAATAMVLIALAAAFSPARRATRVDPVEILRAQ